MTSIKGITPILNVRSVPESIRWFESLGWKRDFTWNGEMIDEAALENEKGPADFGSVCADNSTIFLCEDGQGGRGETGSWMSWWIENKTVLGELYAKVQDLGYDVARELVDEPWGVREFHLRHPDGHTFRVSSGIDE